MAEWRFGKTPKSPRCPVPGPWLKLLAEVVVVGVAACGQGPRRTSRPPSPPHSQHHEAAPPVGARGVATRRGGGPGAPGVTCPRGAASPRSGSGPEDAARPVPAGGTRRCGAAPAPGAPGRPPAPSPGDSAPSGLRETPLLGLPRTPGGLRGSTRGARDRGSVQPCALGPFRPGAWPPAALGRDTPLALGLGGAWWRLGRVQASASPTPRHVTPGRFSAPAVGSHR